MSKNKCHYIFLILTIVWMIVIYSFSAQDGDTSSDTSGRIVSFVVSVFIPDLDTYPSDEQENILNTISLIIRKGAHFTEYAILGILSFCTAVTYKQKNIKYLWFIVGSLIFSCLYAISDELHQGSVAGRAPAILDVCIDTSGALCGILILWFIISKKNQRNSNIL